MSQNQAASSTAIIDQTATLPTFMDHVRELQGRLFSVAIVFLIMASLAYPFFDTIVNFLIAPLGDEHELVYLTPAGAFSFIIKVCIYVGAIGSLPFFIYHLYRFLLPAVQAVNIRRALGYTLISLLLAALGLSFAYFVSLPAALYFLTSFNLHHINPMLTIDSYFSFIMTYMLAGAVLFQLPLIITIIDNIKPLTPGKMMNYQRHLIVGSFIIAAIISPTPDALNQTLLAMPVILMYQVGIMIIWVRHRKRRKAMRTATRFSRAIGRLAIIRSVRFRRPVVTAAKTKPIPLSASRQPKAVGPALQTNRVRRIDGFGLPTPNRSVVASIPRAAPRPSRSMNDMIKRSDDYRRPSTSPGFVSRGIDGFMMPTRQSQ